MAGAVLFYNVVSLSLVFLNKKMFSGETPASDAPLFLTWTQLLVAIAWCYLLAFAARSSSTFSFFPKELPFNFATARAIAPLSLVFTGMIVCNNLTLKLVEVSFYQVARSLTILFSIAVSYLAFGKKTSALSAVGCGVVVVGYVVATGGEVNVSLQGLFFGCLSSLFVALNAIFVKQSLAVVDDNQWVLMFYNNVNAAIILPLIIYATEVEALVDAADAMASSSFFTMLLIVGSFGFLINIASFLQIKVTSPLTHNVSGTFKACVQTVIAALIFQNPTTPFFWLGFFLSMLGTSIYSYARFTEL